MASYHGDIDGFKDVKFQGGSSDKSLVIAYLLWFLFGLVGAHRFYMGHVGSGAAQLGLLVGSVLAAFALPVLATILIVILWLWVLADAVLLWFMR